MGTRRGGTFKTYTRWTTSWSGRKGTSTGANAAGCRSTRCARHTSTRRSVGWEQHVATSGTWQCSQHLPCASSSRCTVMFWNAWRCFGTSAAYSPLTQRGSTAIHLAANLSSSQRASGASNAVRPAANSLSRQRATSEQCRQLSRRLDVAPVSGYRRQPRCRLDVAPWTPLSLLH